ncbi:glycosyltransferase [Oenococcus kitaharae]|uniref:Glycosyl transferase n=1 Tax=Oenococcus kitaharae DSM 17330 TaxID=1045004 RepID=G9WIQ2_9LACO|nr:glycosyltransferase [Oenococcus kitaharae]EHN58191.1 glycosyl transferase [Oenococcus kitaharae DSM 17330]OEY81616.1 glycosyl transferase [Oenococcus kitaharae]OEY83101.1 glycosyl transferase [Oenococcus kitaharae]OEY84353.1 glycosyl transferase [Oenococcus kitaharae]
MKEQVDPITTQFSPGGKKSILFIGMTSNRGGTETFIFNMAKLLQQNFNQEFDVYILDDTRQGISMKSDFVQLDIKIIKLNLPFGRRNHFRKNRILKSFFEERAFDLVHINANSLASVAYLGALKDLRTKIIFHSHNTSLNLNNLTQKILYYGRMPHFRHILDHSNLIKVAASDAAGKWMFHDKQFIVLPNGVNPKDYKINLDTRSSMRKSLGIPEDASVFLFVGRLEFQKYPDFGVTAFNDLLVRFPTLQGKVFLVMVGGGSLDGFLHTLSTPNKQYIKFLGVRRDVPNLMSMADFLLLPSRFEAMPFVAIEAQASGMKILQSAESRNTKGEITEGHDFPSLRDSLSVWSTFMKKMIDQRPSVLSRKRDNELIQKSPYNMSVGFVRFINEVYLGTISTEKETNF